MNKFYILFLLSFFITNCSAMDVSSECASQCYDDLSESIALDTLYKFEREKAQHRIMSGGKRLADEAAAMGITHEQQQILQYALSILDTQPVFSSTALVLLQDLYLKTDTKNAGGLIALNIGLFYLRGTPYIAKNLPLAHFWLMLAASHSSAPEAQARAWYSLGKLAEKTGQQSIHWFVLAAQQNQCLEIKALAEKKLQVFVG